MFVLGTRTLPPNGAKQADAEDNDDHDDHDLKGNELTAFGGEQNKSIKLSQTRDLPANVLVGESVLETSVVE